MLKNGRYNLRHVGSKKLVILPDGSIERISQRSKSTIHRSKSERRVPTIHSEGSGDSGSNCNCLQQSKKIVNYSVNKQQVRSRILNFINAQSGSKELYFITVTFPPIVSDSLAYKFFNQWLTVLRQSGLLHNYLWVAERQSIGTIHYHIAIPHKIYVPKANKAMVTILSNAVRKKQLYWNLQAAKRYNGVDIAKNRKTKRVTNFAVKKGKKSLITYLTKYVTKNEHKYTHLAWHCSRGFSNLVLKVSFTNSEVTTCGFELYLSQSILFETEHSIFIPWVNEPPPAVTEYLSFVNNTLLKFSAS